MLLVYWAIPMVCLLLISLSANQTASLQTTWECSLWSLGRCIRAGSNKSKYTMVQIGAWSRSHHKRTAQEFIWKWTKTTSSKGSRCSSLSLALCLCVCVWEYLYIFLKRKAKTVAQKQKSFLSEVKWGFHWPASIPAARGYSTAGVPLCDLNHAFYFESWRNRFHSYGSVVACIELKSFFFKKSIDAKWKEQIGKARLWAWLYCQQKTMNKTQKKPHLMKH